ncbi:MAG: hypothetical protein AAF830_02810, partial [Pseudomonadota bacterium]
MILQRFAKALRNQDWSTVFTEVLIVVIGVFLGIQLGNWNETRQKNDQTQDYLQRLQSEFVDIERRASVVAELYVTNAQGTSTLIEIVQGAEPPSDEAMIIAFRRTFAYSLPSYRSATYAEMVSSGNLSLIRDVPLREALVAYDQKIDPFADAFNIVARNLTSYPMDRIDGITVQISEVLEDTLP